MMLVKSSTRTAQKRTNREWLTALRGNGPARERALADLQAHLSRAVLVYLTRHRSEVQNMNRGDLMRLVEGCTAAALHTIDEKLPAFRDDSRFTTWAYGHAVKQAANGMRYRFQPTTSPD